MDVLALAPLSLSNVTAFLQRILLGEARTQHSRNNKCETSCLFIRMERALLCASALQSSQNHLDAAEQQVALTFERCQRRVEHHEQRMQLAEEHHARRKQHRVELFDKDMFQRDYLALKENMRDLWQQKNEVFQVRMVVVTLLFGCCFATVSDGLPQLVDAAASVYGTSNFTSNTNTSASENNSTVVASSSSSWNTSLGDVRRLSVALAILQGMGLLCLTASIATTLRLYLRLSTYDVDRPLRRYRLCGHTHRDFVTFFACQCKSLDSWSLRLFYGGAATTIAAALTLVGLIFLETYGILWEVEVVLLPVIGGTALAMAVVQLVFPDQTRASHT